MKYRMLGDTAILISVLGMGCGSFGKRVGPTETCTVVRAALDVGVNFFDTADVYWGHPGQGEEILASALGPERANVILATKFGMNVYGANGDYEGPRGSRTYVRQSVEASLRRLSTDWIDLYQLHEPDPETPIEETLSALEELVHEGKIRCFGSSNFSAQQIRTSDELASVLGLSGFSTAQNKYSIYDPSAEATIIPACIECGIRLIPYWPLEFGLLTGKYRRGEAAPHGSRLAKENDRFVATDFDRLEALERLAHSQNASLLQLSLGHLASHPVVASVIAGATRPEQVQLNALAIRWTATEEMRNAVTTLSSEVETTVIRRQV